MNWKHLAAFLLGIAIIGGLWAAQDKPPSVQAITLAWSGSGHADRTSESFVHWDEDEPPIVPTSCAKCHSALGYLDFVGEDGSQPGQVDAGASIGTVVSCDVCHNPSSHEMRTVRFPSGQEIQAMGSEANCLQCHQGRSSTVAVNEKTEGLPADETVEGLGFINVHYAVAGATQQGAAAQGAYQYAGQTYVGRYEHVDNLQTCTECHSPHSLKVNPQQCSPCHLNVVDDADLGDIRVAKADFDGDGDAKEGILGEIETAEEALYQALQDYAATVLETPIVYAGAFPYFFVDSNGNGTAEDTEANFGNQYRAWSPRLVRAAYNYHYAHEDPGAYAHNPMYLLQVLYDSIADLGERVPTNVVRLTRP